MAEAEPTPCAGKLQGKVAIITGGASGIGEATAHLFVDHGVKAVVIADIEDEKGREVAASIGAHRCTYIHCDVRDEDQVKSMIKESIKLYGQIDIMFSNAGMANTIPQTILDMDFDAFDRLFAVNVRGMAGCVKHAGAAMIKSGVRGSIVCTASVAGHIGFPFATDYCMSKHALLGLMRSAALQLGAHGIRVNCVSPTGIATPLACHGYHLEAEALEKLFSSVMSLKGSVLKVNHIADAVLFLASDEAALITGHDLVVDGGSHRLP